MLDLSDFAYHEQSEDNLMVSISQTWYHNSNTMAAKPIKSLELHYTMIQFLIRVKGIIPYNLLFNAVGRQAANKIVYVSVPL